MSESHSETRVLEYPFSTPFTHTKGYSRVLSGGQERASANQPSWQPYEKEPARRAAKTSGSTKSFLQNSAPARKDTTFKMVHRPRHNFQDGLGAHRASTLESLGQLAIDAV